MGMGWGWVGGEGTSMVGEWFMLNEWLVNNQWLMNGWCIVDLIAMNGFIMTINGGLIASNGFYS